MKRIEIHKKEQREVNLHRTDEQPTLHTVENRIVVLFSWVRRQNGDDSGFKTGSKYTYMHDEWRLYVATFLSQEAIKIERWDRFIAPSENVFS